MNTRTGIVPSTELQPKVNYKLQDGDTVVLRYARQAGNYGPTPEAYSSKIKEVSLLPGAVGKVVCARTPYVSYVRTWKGKNVPYFANVDVKLQDGRVVRLRCGHEDLRVFNQRKQPCQTNLQAEN